MKKIATKNLEDIINQSEYYYVNSNLTTANFPIPDTIETENWKIITIDKTMTSEEALAKIKAEGYRPANAYELAIWSNNHRDEVPKRKWYIALDQLWYGDGHHWIPYVRAYSDGGFEFRLGRFGLALCDGLCLLCFCDSTLALGHSDKVLDTLTLKTSIENIVPTLTINISGKKEELILKSEVLELLNH